MCNDRKIEVLFDIGAGDEASKQTRERDLDFARLSKGSLKTKGVPAPVGASSALKMDHAP